MQLIKKNTEYALKALFFLYGSGPALKSLNEIAAGMEIPKYLLRRLMQILGGADIVKAVSGAQGGYELSQQFEVITLYELMTLMQGEFVLNNCFMEGDDCGFKSKCPIKPKLTKIQSELEDTLRSVTVRELAEAFKNKGRA
jgi:Rrf2 family iron-responsive transcriptional regulator